MNSGIPSRLLIRAAALHTTAAGQITEGWKRPVSSSNTNTVPIKGLLNPPAKPAPAPIAINEAELIPASRLGKRRRRAWATAAPTCTTGPSLPRGIRARLAALQRARRLTVAKGAISRGAWLGFSMLSRVWGMPEPAPRASLPDWSSSRRGITPIGARAIARVRSVQKSPLKPGNCCSSRSWAWSIRLRGQQARPTSRPSSCRPASRRPASWRPLSCRGCPLMRPAPGRWPHPGSGRGRRGGHGWRPLRC